MIKGLFEEFTEIIFPLSKNCAFCGSKTRDSGNVCPQCRREIASLGKLLYCVNCGRYFQFTGRERVLCSECRHKKWPFRSARSFGPHRGLLKQAVEELKYTGRQSIATSLGRLLAGLAIEEGLYRDVDIVVPVPLSAERRRERGFNQAELLAGEVARVLGLDMDGDSLRKVLDTPPQAGLSKYLREKNLKGAFRVKEGQKLAGKRVLLIDDVFTTGSTLTAASVELLSHKIRSVTALTFTGGVRSEKPTYYPK